jgi:tetratricopeptide (TPR) repeat protein
MTAAGQFRVFVSAVSSELKSFRGEIARVLRTAAIDVEDQEHFHQGPGTLLEKLNDYISKCDAVLFLVGDRAGEFPKGAPPEALGDVGVFNDYCAATEQTRASYTQWEYLLAKHHGKPHYVFFTAKGFIPDGKDTQPDPDDASQAAFRQWLKQTDKQWDELVTREKLVERTLVALLGNRSLHLPNAERLREFLPRPKNLPFTTLGSLFKGRENIMRDLRASLEANRGVAIAGKALHGLGGVGKTRLAIEYALRHQPDYSALLFLAADTPEKLNASLAALAGPDILDLPEQDAPQDSVKIPAALKWLNAHPGWLLILDNIDDATAADAAEALVGRLNGGHVLITGRHPNFSAGVETLELDALALEDAANFLLERSKKRAKTPDDEKLARDLANEFGRLALGLSQAAAYIDTQRIGFARYLDLWRENREKVLNWFDPRLVSYNHDVGLAATWATSVDKLTAQGLRLLQLCAFLDPAPIPKTLLSSLTSQGREAATAPSPVIATASRRRSGKQSRGDIRHAAASAPPSAKRFTLRAWLLDCFASLAMTASKSPKVDKETDPGGEDGFDGEAALADLYAYSLATPATIETGKTTLGGFTVHRLVQDFARRRMGEEDRRAALQTALNWVDAAFTGNPADVRTWPALDPLAPHALALASRADAAGIAEPTGRLYSDLGTLSYAKARSAEAEPLMRRALAIDEASYGPDHPRVAIDLNNLAQLLQDTNRLDEAEPLMRRALAIDEASYGPDHPRVAIDLNNLAQLLRATNRVEEAVPLMRRALAIDEASYGPDHPRVAIDLNNLAALLQATNRLAEAEPLMRRALAIFEASYGPDHPDVATNLNNLAALLQATNRIKEAEPLSRRHLEIFLAFTAQTGHQHPHLLAALNNYLSLLLAAGRDEAQARAEIAALLEKHGVALGQQSPDEPPPRDPADPSTWGDVKRNEPCPCGSDKRYKHCHGALV